MLLETQYGIWINLAWWGVRNHFLCCLSLDEDQRGLVTANSRFLIPPLSESQHVVRRSPPNETINDRCFPRLKCWCI